MRYSWWKLYVQICEKQYSFLHEQSPITLQWEDWETLKLKGTIPISPLFCKNFMKFGQTQIIVKWHMLKLSKSKCKNIINHIKA